MGDTDLIFMEMFRPTASKRFRWPSGSATPPELVSAHLNIPEETLAKFPRGAQGIVPLP